MAVTMDDKNEGVGTDVVLESHPPRDPTAYEYITTRFSTLKPPMNHAPNPIRLLRMLSGKQWLFFLVGFTAWVSLLLSPTIHRPDHAC